ncbi:hypothetical protein GJ744_005495 [Endocarpon pusillum]|uniref:Sequence orphan n=1 Tax=Endocarpon pusillum TaxID=364733 RepID=A0A8H7E132_9EURO|nr:hypothetical protein GJ744_005495 [Endocarpon pusillum]
MPFGQDMTAHNTLNSRTVNSITSVGGQAAVLSTTQPTTTTKADAVPNWSTTNIGLRLGADATSASCAAITFAPIVTIIDRSVVHKASTGTSFRNAFLHSLQPLLKAPHHFLVSRPFLLIFALYSSTYFTANAIDTITSTLHAQSPTTVTTGPTKFLATSAVNMSLSVYKDSHFARMFSATAATATRSNPATSTIPKISYLLFSLRDSLTIFASFNLPPLIAAHLGPLSPHLPSLFAPLLSTPSSRTNTAQFLAPALMQLVSTPLHLLGLDMFNRQRRLGAHQRLSRVRRDWGVSALARMGRIVPAFGVGGVVNAAARRALMPKIDA